LLTGISRGVGYESAKRFLGEGARLFGVAKDGDRLSRALETLRPLGDVAGVQADLAEPEGVKRVAAAVAERWGGALDVLMNNAAILVEAPSGKGLTFEDDPENALERSLAVNVVGPFRLIMALLPLLRRGDEPRIVNVGSGAGTFVGLTEDRIASYRLSKWTLHGMTMLLATHLKGTMAVNAFDPGWVRTDMGGPEAPGSPVESAEGALAVVTLPFSVTGKFWKDGNEIPF
jgi:NAD(P)-dependent dehydrogenase (short-subunit alcohol dehydrogenase family)